jgi:hypothetical protein
MLDEDEEGGSSDQFAVGGDDAAILMQLTCSHVFHAECVGPWLQRHRECPLCKRDAVHGDGSADREAAAAALFVPADVEVGSGRAGVEDSDSLASRQAIAALAGYQVCNRSTVVICVACVTGLVITTSSEVSYVQYCGPRSSALAQTLELRCGFFVAISAVSFSMATVAVAALHTPVRGRCLWDGFSGWCLYSFTIISVCSSWYDKLSSTHDSAYGYDDNCRDGNCGTYSTGLTDEERAIAQAVEILSIMLRCAAALVAVVQLCTARERELSIQRFLQIRSIVFQATASALGLPVHDGSGGEDGARPTFRGETQPGAITEGLGHTEADTGGGVDEQEQQSPNALLAPVDVRVSNASSAVRPEGIVDNAPATAESAGGSWGGEAP